MLKQSLGLPLEYQVQPEYFDLLNIGNRTDKENETIKSLLSRYLAKEILDLSCGTGSQVFYLTDYGFHMTGVDFSPELLNIARQKAKEMGRSYLEFIDGDMRTAQVGTFDAVITIFNAIGHLTVKDFEKTLQNVAKNLKPNGIYVFDIFNIGAMTDKVVEDLAMNRTKTQGDTVVHQVQYSKLNRKNGRLTSYDDYTIQQGEEAPKKVQGEFTLQIYTARELNLLLDRNGFNMVDRCGIDGESFVPYETLRMVTVAQKR